MATTTKRKKEIRLTRHDTRFLRMCVEQYLAATIMIRSEINRLRSEILSQQDQAIAELNNSISELQTELDVITVRMNDELEMLVGDKSRDIQPCMLTLYVGSFINPTEVAAFSTNSWAKFIRCAGKKGNEIAMNKSSEYGILMTITIAVEGKEFMCCECTVDDDGKMYEHYGQGVFSYMPLTISRIMRYSVRNVSNRTTIHEDLECLRKQSEKEGIMLGLYGGTM